MSTNTEIQSIINKIFNKEVSNVLEKQIPVEVTTDEKEISVFKNAETYYQNASIFNLNTPIDISKIGLPYREQVDIILNNSTLTEEFLQLQEDETAEEAITRTTNEIYNSFLDSGLSSEEVTDIMGNIESLIDSATEAIYDFGDAISDTAFFSSLSPLLSGMATLANSLVTYNDGSTETQFGGKQEASWVSFKKLTQGGGSYTVNVIASTPLNSANASLYGSMILGVPFNYTSLADPRKRTMINTFVKDSKFLSLTPGLPKFSGVSGFSSINSLINSSDVMFEYLLKNGVDNANYTKDKRYYTFEPSYGKFYSYLETMLNAIWLKMGLGSTDSNREFNIMSFFGSELRTEDNANPEAQYCSALGLFVNPSGTVTESITNDRTSIGSDMSGTINNAASEFQGINYRTGMGTGSDMMNVSRSIAVGTQAFTMGKDFLSSMFENTINFTTRAGSIGGKIAGGIAGFALDTVLAQGRDTLALTQQFAVTNGMKVVYPELWADSAYTKSMTFDFNFVSPYGDPLSIFKYVYVPFCVLLALTTPRQADFNGYVSPFFVRADLPGIINSDLALISSMSYTRGGPNSLFTKDGYPRAISGSFTIDDMYPYLSMSRRLSFLAANPSYTSFLDSMVGLNSIYSENNTSALDKYWGNMLNRVNGTFEGGLWNSYDANGRANNFNFMKDPNTSIIRMKPNSINWMRKV